MPGTTSEPSVALSFANNFWGKEDAGVGPLLQRMHDAKTTCEELKSFYTTRATIEDDFARKLLALSKKPLGSSETGSLRVSMDVMRVEVESMAKAHQSIAGQMRTELDEPLGAHSGAMRERRKIVQGGCEKLLQLKMKQTQQVNKTRDRYEQDCLKIKGYLAQGHMVMGQEEKKNKTRLEKAQIALTSSNAEYEAAIKALEETTGRWNRDWKAACDKFQDLEEERIDFLKSSLWTFANICSTVCVSDDASCEKIRISLEDCEVEKDIATFIKERGTGQEIPDPPKFINFCRGDYSDDSASETHEENYRLAQFPRAGNPTFRSSSPNSSISAGSDLTAPVTHNKTDQEPEAPVELEPNLEVNVNLNEARLSIRRERECPGRDHRVSNESRRRAIDLYTQPSNSHGNTVSESSRLRHETQYQLHIQQQQSAPPRAQQYETDPVKRHTTPNVPHNEYPLDGMTMYCRPSGMVSDSSSVSSSGDTLQQFFSNSKDEDKQKRKSGFFNGASPFRRKSKSEKEQGNQLQTPQQQYHQAQQMASQDQRPSDIRRKERSSTTSHKIVNRNTWSAISIPKPTFDVQANDMPGWSGVRQRQSHLILGRGQHESPEPIDPRASLALNVGSNVFDVSQPDLNKTMQTSNSQDDEGHADPIAQALAELKGVTGSSSKERNTADRFFGLSTPAPSVTPGPAQRSVAATVKRGTPPPTYVAKTNTLNLPPPAFTSAQMQQTTQKYAAHREQMFDASRQKPVVSGEFSGRPAFGSLRAKTIDYNRPESQQSSREDALIGQEQTRTKSPATRRSISPRPQIYGNEHYRALSPLPRPGYSPTDSPNPHSQSRPGTASSTHRGHYQAYSGPTSPAISHEVALSQYRRASPTPSHHSQQGGKGSLSSQGQEARNPHLLGAENPASAVAPYQGGTGSIERHRSRSVDTSRQYGRDGRPILNYTRAMYHYSAIIAEELSFQKGDILAILRQQDDGWWEAEIVGTQGRPGLVPSNYLQNC